MTALRTYPFHFSFQFTEEKQKQAAQDFSPFLYWMCASMGANMVCKGFLIKNVFTPASRNKVENGCKRQIKIVLPL